MLRNYNGNVNRVVLRDLKKLCGVNAENENILFEAFDENGEVSVYENLDPFTGCPDEMSTTVTLKSETEIKEYLKKDFIGRVEGYLSHKKPTEDYLLSSLIEFIKAKCEFPEKDVMRQLEKDAEAKRIAELSLNITSTQKDITEQDVAKEILELAEEIMESRRENNPKSIGIRSDFEILWIETNKLHGNIFCERYCRTEDLSDYSCALAPKDSNDDIIDEILIKHCSDGETYVTAKDLFDNKVDVSITEYLITIHQCIVEMAKAEGVEFTSEIDYKKFKTA